MMKGKTIRKIPILLLLMGFLSFVSWSGAGAADLNLDDQDCAPVGSTVTFTATVDSAPNSVSALGFEVAFDNTVLTYVDFTAGELVQDFLLFNVSNPSPGILRVAGITINPITAGASGNLVMFNFTVAAAGGSDLILQNLTDDMTGWTTDDGTYCPPEIPVLSVDPVVLDFEECDTELTFTIENVGEGTLTWNITMDQAWITVAPTSGTTTTMETDTVTVTVDRAGLDPDEYTGTVTVTSDGGTQDVTIQMTVLAPALSVDLTTLDFGETQTQMSCNINNTAPCTVLTWNAAVTVGQAWITVNPTSGTTTTETDTVNVTVDRTQIPGYPTPGQYTGTVTVDSDGGTQDVTILATITPNPVLGVDPTSLEFTSIETAETFNITNQGTGTLEWNVAPNQPWIAAAPLSGTTTTETDTVTVTVDRTGLAPGQYTGVASVTSNGGNRDVSITMDVGIAIRGKVLDLSQIPFDDVTVENIGVSIATPADYTSIGDTSGPNGDYELENVPPNTDDVSILCVGGAGFVNTYTAFFRTGVQDIEEPPISNVYITPQTFYDDIDGLFGVTQQAGNGVIAGAVLDLDLEGIAGATVSTEPSYDVFYFDEDGNPDATLEETSSNGLFIIFNIDVGDVEMTATMSPAFATTKARAYADSVTVAPVAEEVVVIPEEAADEDDDWCFVATAAFGSPFEAHVQTLRDFRDRYLLTNPMGRAFVSLYYQYSPPVADFIAKNGVLRAAARVGLYPVAAFRFIAPHSSHGGMLALAILLVGGVGVGIFIHRRRRST
jgi:hypothetical protein